jgi:hypothetical protein
MREYEVALKEGGLAHLLGRPIVDGVLDRLWFEKRNRWS